MLNLVESSVLLTRDFWGVTIGNSTKGRMEARKYFAGPSLIQHLVARRVAMILSSSPRSSFLSLR